jgi:hypothetical protein
VAIVASVFIGLLVGLVLDQHPYSPDVYAKKSDKQKLREENQRLQDQINAMKQIRSQNVILPNGSSVAFSQLPPETQRAMLNNSALINANIPADNGSSSSSSHHNKHSDNNDLNSNNPLAKLGKKIKNLFK